MPEVAEPPAAPAREEVNPGLRALFDIEPPAEYPVTTTDEPGEEAPVVKAPPEKKPESPAPEEKKPEEVKPDALKLRLAPDFSAAEEKTTAIVEPDADLVELDKAIEAAPSEKARVDLRKFRDQLATLKTEVQTLKTRPTAEPTDYAEIKTTLETVTKERDEAVARLERTDLFNSPKFQRDHVLPRNKSFEAAANIVKESGGDAAALGRAFNLTGKAQAEALDEIRGEITSETMRGQFDLLVRDINAKNAEINEKLRHAKQTAEELKRNETVQTHEQRVAQQKQFEALLGSAFDDLRDNVGLEILKKTGKPEYKWWDDQVDEIQSVAREVLLESTPQKAAIASVMAAAYGPTRDLLKATQQALKAVEQENRELKGADPTLKDGGKPPVVETVAGDADSILEGLRAGKYKK